MLVLPTQKLPNEFQQYTKPQSKVVRRMINGYRNRLTKNLQWVLYKDDNYCGQGYCYEVIQDTDKLTNLSKYQDSKFKISVVNNYQNHYVLVWNNNGQFYQPKDSKISESQVKRVLEEVGAGVNERVANNLLLNSFQSYEELLQSQLLKYICPSKSAHDNTNKQNKEVNNLAGKMLLSVPQYDSKTGEWGKQHKYQLKIEKNVQVS